MASIMQPFNPIDGQNITIAVTAADATATFSNITPGSPNGTQFLLTNVGTATVFWRVNRPGDTTVASAADTPILSGDRYVISTGAVSGEVLTFHAISPGGTATLYVTPGAGW